MSKDGQRGRGAAFYRRIGLRAGLFLATTGVAIMSSTALHATEAVPVYRQAGAPITERVRDLVSKMTLEEKVAQLQSQSVVAKESTAAIGIVNKKAEINEDVARRALSQGIGSFVLTPFIPQSPVERVEQQNAIQAWVLKNTRLGIPILFQGELLHGAAIDGATAFPQAIALGSTWNPDLMREVFGAVGQESRAGGIGLGLGPVFDLIRDPRFGRVEEMYSEDPYLVGEMGAAAVEGLQGRDATISQDHVIATAKHFVYGQPENGTNIGPSDFSERTMRSVFMPPFEKAVKQAHLRALMPSYNENDGGMPSPANSWLMKDVLRNEWGFRGLTVSDWSAVRRLVETHHVAATAEDAGVMSFNAGMDMELPNPWGFPGLVAAVRDGRVRETDIDAAVGRVLTAKFEAGLFENPYTDIERTKSLIGTKAHIGLARKAADQAMVLLKNENDLLPLDPRKVRSIAVIGPNADKVRVGSYGNAPPYFVTILDGIRNRVGAGVTVSYAEGVRISEPDKSLVVNKFMPYRAPSPERDAQLITQAVETARNADVIILALGGNETLSRESFAFGGDLALGDTDTLELPGRQNDLVAAISKLGKPMVAVLLNGRPYAIEPLSKTVPAILEGWYLGQETGNAVAGVLFGDTNPSGRLPVTIARNVGQLPVFYYHTPAARLGYIGADNAPLYPFGYGLSYTRFSYGPLLVDKGKIGRSASAKLSVEVANAGTRTGIETVQFYVHPKVSSVVQPVKRLVGFKRVELKPGKRTTIAFNVGPEQLAILDRQMKRTVEPGVYELMVGANSADLQSVEITVEP